MPRRLSGVDSTLGANAASWLWTLDRYDSYVQRGQREELAKELQGWFRDSTSGGRITLVQARQWLDRVGSARQAAAHFEQTANVPSGTGQYRQTFLSPSRPWVVRAQALFMDRDTGLTWREDIEIATAGPPVYSEVQSTVDRLGQSYEGAQNATFGPGPSRNVEYLGMHLRTLESLTWD